MLHVASRPDPRVFAALADPTRLALIERLRAASPRSISGLADGADCTRQAITRHLEVLRDAGLVRGEKRGREHLYALEPAPLLAVGTWAHAFVQGWAESFDRLDALLATPPEEQP